MIKAKYWLRSLVFALIMASFSVVFFLLLDDAKRNDIAPRLSSIVVGVSVSFSFTIIAFSLASFTLLQLVQDREWFKVVSSSKPYKSFLARLFISIVSTLIQFVFALVFTFMIQISSVLLAIIICSLSVFIMAYIIFWVFDCLLDYIKIIRD